MLHVKKLLLILALPFFLLASPKLERELATLSKEQLKVLYKTFYYGKQHDLQWTLTAIAWKESNFGKYRRNDNSKDYGIFQVNLNTYKRRYANELIAHNLSDSTIIDYHIRYFEFNVVAAVDEIRYWQSVRSDWLTVWASYNDGTVIGPKGKAYATDIARRIKTLQHFIGEP